MTDAPDGGETAGLLIRGAAPVATCDEGGRAHRPSRLARTNGKYGFLSLLFLTWERAKMSVSSVKAFWKKTTASPVVQASIDHVGDLPPRPAPLPHNGSALYADR
ncbi:hypothetical protein OG589_41085 [Sphaerisporangium sp. NBC_01403]|uniref:hypothetical protein n=1 Tax=Sphaerisporangium sp. NBC_01403 TaxID=2903599 RepID=UPI0032514978